MQHRPPAVAAARSLVVGMILYGDVTNDFVLGEWSPDWMPHFLDGIAGEPGPHGRKRCAGIR